MFPLSVRAHPYGPCPQLHHGRRGRALQARQGLQRAPSDGLGRVRHAGRERGDAEQGAPGGRGPTTTSRRCANSSNPWGCRSTGAENWRPAIRTITDQQQSLFLDFLEQDLVYRKMSKVNWDPVDHDRARQRTGDRRLRLALRRAGGAARADPVVLPDHRVQRSNCSRLHLDSLDRWPEKVRIMQRNWIGKVRRRAHELRPDRTCPTSIEAAARSSSSPRGMTPCSARASAPCRSTTRWPWSLASNDNEASSTPSSRSAASVGTSEEDIERAEKKGFDTGHQSAFIRSIRTKLLPLYIANFHPDGLRHRRHFRLPRA